MKMDARKLYGKGISFPPRIGVDGRMQWSVGEDNIRECIKIILLTRRKERLMHANFGGSLDSYLFEPNTPATRELLKKDIERALKHWEPRIRVESVDAEAGQKDESIVLVTITYLLLASQLKERVSLNVTLGQL